MEFLEGHLPGTANQNESRMYDLPFELRQKIANNLHSVMSREFQREEPMAGMINEEHALENLEDDLRADAQDSIEDATDYLVIQNERANFEREMNEMLAIIKSRIQQRAFLLRHQYESKFDLNMGY